MPYSDGVERFNEARIIILGDKGAGKTSLARKLLDINAKMPQEYESTEGVSILQWKLPEEQKGNSVNVHIWDFAGHTITHSAHRCFMSSRCLYIYVYNGRVESGNDPEYWLEQIKIHGGNSPILFLINERDGHRADIAKKTLHNEYPSIIGYYSVDLADANTGKLDFFRQTVVDLVRNNPTWNKQKISASAYLVKEALNSYFETNSADLITLNEFNKIAKTYGVPSKNWEHVLEDLHALGVCFNYKELRDLGTLVLNPGWLVNGIYKIINWGYNNGKYKLSLTDGAEIFTTAENKLRYPIDKVQFLFRLMNLYELAFFEDDAKLFMPILLPSDRPDELPAFPYGDRLIMSFDVEKVLPPNIVSRLIVRRYHEIYDETEIWRKGAVLHYHTGDAIALITEDMRSIVVRVRGKDKSPYLVSLRETLINIFDDYKAIKPDLRYEVLVPEDLNGKAHGEIKVRNTEQQLMLSENTINAYLRKSRPYFDPFTNREISLINTAQQYSYPIHIADNISINTKKIIDGAILNTRTQIEEEEEQSNILSALKLKYQDGDLVLVIGAGVSMDAKVPLWDELIKKLLIELISNKLSERGKRFTADEIDSIAQLAYGNMEDSPLAQMRFIRGAFDVDAYKKSVHKVLYGNNPEINTDLLATIAKLCKPRRNRSGIKHVITYNFDDLLERVLENREIDYKIVHRDTDISTGKDLNIYHVHGYLPKDLTSIDFDVNLVFSEEDYHKIYRDAYAWSNIVQLNSFRENTCLFIGCSLNDPNLRRLLDAATRREEKPRHYVIKVKRSVDKEKINNIDTTLFEEYTGIDNRIRESYFRSLGIKVLWVNNYEEIPQILLSLIDGPS